MDVTCTLNSLKILVVPLKLFWSWSLPPSFFFPVFVFLLHRSSFPLTSHDPQDNGMGTARWWGGFLLALSFTQLEMFHWDILGVKSFKAFILLHYRVLRGKSSNCLLSEPKPGYQCLQVGRRKQARSLSIQYVYRLLPKSVFCMICSPSAVTA